MDTLSVVIETEQTVVTLTGPSLPVDLFAEAVEHDGVTWASLYETGVIVGNPMPDAGAEAFGLPAGDYVEAFAHVELIDPDSGLWSVSRGEGLDPLGYAVLDSTYSIERWWHAVPDDLTRDDLDAWGRGAPGPDDDL